MSSWWLDHQKLLPLGTESRGKSALSNIIFLYKIKTVDTIYGHISFSLIVKYFNIHKHTNPVSLNMLLSRLTSNWNKWVDLEYIWRQVCYVTNTGGNMDMVKNYVWNLENTGPVFKKPSVKIQKALVLKADLLCPWGSFIYLPIRPH